MTKLFTIFVLPAGEVGFGYLVAECRTLDDALNSIDTLMDVLRPGTSVNLIHGGKVHETRTVAPY